jgi:hypothetical protein
MAPFYRVGAEIVRARRVNLVNGDLGALLAGPKSLSLPVSRLWFRRVTDASRPPAKRGPSNACSVAGALCAAIEGE